MNEISVYIPRLSPALSHAAQTLAAQGITTAPSATDADAILLPVPTPADLDLAPFRNDLVVGGVLPDHIPRKSTFYKILSMWRRMLPSPQRQRSA